MDREEELLIKKAQQGNIYSFERLIYRYDSRVLKLIYDMVQNIEDTRDIYQEVFTRVFQSINKFRYQSEFYTWIYRIAINTTISFIRKHGKVHKIPLEQESSAWNIISPSNPEQEILNSELGEQIRNSIDKLSSKQRAVFLLKHYHGYKLKEIAGMLDCSEGTVKSYLFRATKKLQQELQLYQQQ